MPSTAIRATPERIRLLHMKDMASGAEPHDAPAGHGTLPFPDIVEAARSASVDWYVVEQDEPNDPLDDIGRAFMYLAGLAR